MQRVLGVLLCLCGGCFYPADRGRVLEARVDKLAASNDELAAELRRNEEKVAIRVEEKIAQMEKALENLDKASRRSGADTGVLLQRTVEEVAQLRGQVETYLHRIGELETQLKKAAEENEKKWVEFQGSEAAKAAEAKKRAEALKRPENKKEFIALAEEKAKEGDLPLARQLYAEFLKKWAKDALTGDAHFGLAETYFTEKKCREALFEYGKVIQEFSASRSAPQAYLRSSECFKELKMTEESRLALEELVRLYPKSDAAKTAKTRLAELDKARKPKGKK